MNPGKDLDVDFRRASTPRLIQPSKRVEVASAAQTSLSTNRLNPTVDIDS